MIKPFVNRVSKMNKQCDSLALSKHLCISTNQTHHYRSKHTLNILNWFNQLAC